MDDEALQLIDQFIQDHNSLYPGSFAPIIDDLGAREYCFGINSSGEVVCGEAVPGQQPRTPTIFAARGDRSPSASERAVNFFCAQLLRRGAPVFAEPDLLPYCRGDGETSRPQPYTHVLSWADTAPEEAMAVLVSDAENDNELERTLDPERFMAIVYTDHIEHPRAELGMVTTIFEPHSVLPGFVNIHQTDDSPLRIDDNFLPPICR